MEETFTLEDLLADLALISLPGLKLGLAAAFLGVAFFAAFFAGLAGTMESPLGDDLAEGGFGFVALVAGDLLVVTFAAFLRALDEEPRTARVLCAREDLSSDSSSEEVRGRADLRRRSMS